MSGSGYFKATSIVEYSCQNDSMEWGWLDNYPHSLSRMIVVPASCPQSKTIAIMVGPKVIQCIKTIKTNKSHLNTIRTKSTITCLNAPSKLLSNITFGVQRYKSISILCTGLKNGHIEIWHGDTTQLLTRLMSHSGPVLGISFILKQNANTIVSISQDRTAKVWECEENGFNMCQTIEFPSVILCIAISHSEEMIALGGLNQKLSIFRRDSQKNRIITTSVRHLKHHAHNISTLKFYPDGSLLVSGSWDGKVIIWDTFHGTIKQLLSVMRPPLPLYVFPIQILSLDINRFGTGIVTLTDEGRLNLWNPLEVGDEQSLESFMLNTSPVDERNLGDDKICRSCQLTETANGETVILVPSLISCNALMIPVTFQAPSLKHLTRLELRKRVTNPEKLEALRLPRSLISFLRYDIWS